MKRFMKSFALLALTAALLCSLLLPVAAAEQATHIGIVKARGGLRLRSEASTSSSVVDTAYYGDNVVVLAKVGDWYKVNYNLQIGYMFGEYLTLKERENIDLGTGKIDGSVVNVRSGPSTSNGRVMQLSRGSEVEIFGFNCGWYKITARGQVGYVRSDLIELLDKPSENYGVNNDKTPSQSPDSGSSSGSSKGNALAEYAKGFVGYPYVYGGASPSGFDCSGFMQYVCRQNGISINRTATAQLSNGEWVSRDNLQPGDLVFFGYGNTASHVGMYIGNNKFVHAQNSRTGVVITDLSTSYYDGRYLTARRVVD